VVLDQRGIPFSEDNFLRYIRAGNVEMVDLYLRAGISPDATPDGESALAASANQGHKEIARALINAGAKPLGLLDGLKTGVSKKDLWEKLVSLSGVFTLSSSLVIAGVGWVQREGGSVEEIRPGDVVWFPAGLKHWHGATPTTAMTHIAIREQLNGEVVEWMEKVADEHYRR